MAEIKIVREVIVTITDIRTGAIGQRSRSPVSFQSLRGMDDDGKPYEKHWNEWPEAQLQDFLDCWSLQEHGDDDWTPYEAVYVYRRREGHELSFLDGNPIRPKGDIEYCEKHDQYFHKGDRCLFCRPKIVQYTGAISHL